SGWVRGQDIKTLGGGRGLLFNMHGVDVVTKAVKSANNWQQLSIDFSSPPGKETLQLNCLFGGWGHATGTAWFDDIQLIEVPSVAGLPGRAGETISIITRNYAERAPVDTVAETLRAVPGAQTSLARFVLTGLAEGW